MTQAVAVKSTPTGFPGVRMIRPEDKPSVMGLLRMAHQENGFASMSEHKVENFVDSAIGKKGVIIGIIEESGKPVAFSGLMMAQWWYTDDWHLEEFWTYVHPEHRKSTHCKLLIEFDKYCADRIGLPLHMGILTLERLGPKMRLYQRQIRQLGALFVYGLDIHGLTNQRQLAS